MWRDTSVKLVKNLCPLQQKNLNSIDKCFSYNQRVLLSQQLLYWPVTPKWRPMCVCVFLLRAEKCTYRTCRRRCTVAFLDCISTECIQWFCLLLLVSIISLWVFVQRDKSNKLIKIWRGLTVTRRRRGLPKRLQFKRMLAVHTDQQLHMQLTMPCWSIKEVAWKQLMLQPWTASKFDELVVRFWKTPMHCLTVVWKSCRDGLCQYVDLCFYASSLPCLHTFLACHPYSFLHFLIFFSFLGRKGTAMYSSFLLM